MNPLKLNIFTSISTTTLYMTWMKKKDKIKVLKLIMKIVKERRSSNLKKKKKSLERREIWSIVPNKWFAGKPRYWKVCFSFLFCIWSAWEWNEDCTIIVEKHFSWTLPKIQFFFFCFFEWNPFENLFEINWKK